MAPEGSGVHDQNGRPVQIGQKVWVDATVHSLAYSESLTPNGDLLVVRLQAHPMVAHPPGMPVLLVVDPDDVRVQESDDDDGDG